MNKLIIKARGYVDTDLKIFLGYEDIPGSCIIVRAMVNDDKAFAHEEAQELAQFICDASKYKEERDSLLATLKDLIGAAGTGVLESNGDYQSIMDAESLIAKIEDND